MSLLDLFFPRKCPYCLKLIERGMLECAECRSEFPKEPYIRTIPRGCEKTTLQKQEGT